jgi:CheY-like chemotaxis protein
MARSGPIVIIEDDVDDQEIIAEILSNIKIPNKLIYFEKCEEAFDYLMTTNDNPFLIICDINLPKMNGIELKMVIDNDVELRQKSIPFIFFSTASNKEVITKAYTNLSIQGFFKKTNGIEEMKKALITIIDYWNLSMHPNE